MWRNGESPAEAGLNSDVQLTVECPHYLPAISLFPGGTYDKSTELSLSLSVYVHAGSELCVPCMGNWNLDQFPRTMLLSDGVL